jgi:geranylgeranyl diphosphate synthase type I
MDLYQTIEAELNGRPPLAAWPEMVAVLRRACAGRPRAWQLPLAACQAVGGQPQRAVAAAVALAALQISIILIDDALDDDPRGEHRRLGGPATANLASAFQAAGLEAITWSGAPAAAQVAALRCLTSMIHTTAWGQHLDTHGAPDEAAYWAVVRAKSAPYFRAAWETGALLGGANPATAAAIGELGECYGELIQVQDDLEDVMAVPANPDWQPERSPLPILFALAVAHPDREHFTELRGRAAAGDPASLAAAQTILIRCGAVSYAVHMLVERHRAAVARLAALPLPNPAPLADRFASIIAAVKGLGFTGD